MIQEEPYLSAMATAGKWKYIVSKWNASHGEPIDEDAVALFLCDESCGELTEEQRSFAKEYRTEFEHCNQIAVYRLLQCGEMMRRHLVPGPAEYCRIFLRGRIGPCPTEGFRGGFGPFSRDKMESPAKPSTADSLGSGGAAE